MKKVLFAVLLLSLILPNSNIASAQSAPSSVSLPVKQLKEHQTEMLNLALSAASTIPPEADLTDRSKAQESVLSASLELDQPHFALKHIAQIQDWRQGAVYADLALYFAKNNQPQQMTDCLKKALDSAETADDWRRDRIRVKVALVHAFLGNHDQSKALQRDIEKGDQGKVINAPGFDAQIQELNQLIAQDNFDILRNALNSAIGIYDNVYSNPSKRDALEKLILTAAGKMPPFIRINLLTTLSKSALEHNDPEHAKTLLLPAQEIFSSNKWTLEDLIPLKVTLAIELFKTGDKDKAQKHILESLALYDAETSQILSSKRAPTLIQIAEAYMTFNDRAQALATYKKAIAQGVSNPNGRPRALDLTAACRSIALVGLEPDDELKEQIKSALNGLKAPW